MALDDIGEVMRHRHRADRHSSEFVKLIHDILNPLNDEEGKIPIIRYITCASGFNCSIPPL